MAAPNPPRSDDERILTILHALDGDRIGQDNVCRRFGLTRGQIAGIRDRTIRASDRIACHCDRPENRDGGMPAGWWKGAAT